MAPRQYMYALLYIHTIRTALSNGSGLNFYWQFSVKQNPERIVSSWEISLAACIQAKADRPGVRTDGRAKKTRKKPEVPSSLFLVRMYKYVKKEKRPAPRTRPPLFKITRLVSDRVWCTEKSGSQYCTGQSDDGASPPPRMKMVTPYYDTPEGFGSR